MGVLKEQNGEHKYTSFGDYFLIESYMKSESNMRVWYMLNNLIYIDGKSIMDSGSYLSFDLCHPSDYGHIRMGENLAEIVKDW